MREQHRVVGDAVMWSLCSRLHIRLTSTDANPLEEHKNLPTNPKTKHVLWISEQAKVSVFMLSSYPQ